MTFPGPTEDIPVKVTGNVKNGFTAEFVPIEVGIHMILVEYNGVAVGGTPYYSKAYNSESVGVSDIPKSAAGKTVTFAGKLKSNNHGFKSHNITTLQTFTVEVQFLLITIYFCPK